MATAGSEKCPMCENGVGFYLNVTTGEPLPCPLGCQPVVRCPECAARQRLLAEAEATLRDKRFKYGSHIRSTRARLLGSYEHAVKAARENVEHHMAEHERESR